MESFTKASLATSVAQSVLSKHVRQLEKELNQILLKRTGRGIQLTSEGNLLYSHAKAILKQIALTYQELSDSNHSPVGNVVLGVPPSAGRAMIAEFVSDFRNRFPKATLEIIEAKSWTLHEWLLTGRVEVAILYKAKASSLIEIVPLVQERVFVVSAVAQARLPKAKAISFRELAKIPLILPSHPHAMREFIESVAGRTGVKLDIALQIEGASLILELVRKGHGCTILPKTVVEDDKHSGEFQINPISSPPLKRTLAVAISSQRTSTRLARETLSLIRQHFSKS